jgi:hypothetical protein
MHQMGRGEETGFEPTLAQDRFGYGCDTSLAIGSGNVQDDHLALGIAKSLHHCPHALQSEVDSLNLVSAAL